MIPYHATTPVCPDGATRRIQSQAWQREVGVLLPGVQVKVRGLPDRRAGPAADD
jgi:hypothetical protein